MEVYDKYETVIGLEVHVQLDTVSKAFCGDSTTFGAEPNTHVSSISLGHPGTLPKLNERQIEFAVRLGLALNGEISPVSYFDRKNYFYADLPKGYQITQDRLPICIGGYLPIWVDGKEKKVRIHHIHMEEDAGKSMHDDASPYSFIDLNRAGVPLLEVVTEPDLRSAEEVDAFMSGMRQLVQYLEVCDGNMEQGSMRCDCNVSVRLHGAEKYGERCEIKNLNSMRYAKRAIAYEVKRQIDLLEAGGRVEQQTLNFDPGTGVTSPLRDKEDAHDYRYFPEPDLPPVVVSEEYVADIQANLATLPWVMLERLKTEFGLSDYDADILYGNKKVAQYFLDFTKVNQNYKACANLIINKINPYCQEHQLSIEAFPVAQKVLAQFIELIDSGKVASAMAYQRILPVMIEYPEKVPLAIAEELNLIQSTDTNFLEDLVNEVIAANPDKVKAYQKGKKGLLGFFMGEVMKKSKGKAEPKSTNQLLRQNLEA